ncbi:hypothetical protein [Natronoglycomyces albus]|uniref:Uncharacterized protein n=1 Tax=Natronoglycomyces albus TaxID=2811108 RepID=A0A895XNA5_9ACTN|nr:hypothetical protein [Natronoglycomyces albus]QSB07131.1 hypothetical protein JQS30_16855 [Natronoglycomyces albus]
MTNASTDAAQAQNALIRTVLTAALPRRGEPTLTWHINAEGDCLRGAGSREAVSLAAGRLGGGSARDQIDQGSTSVTVTWPGYSNGTQASIELTVTN